MMPLDGRSMRHRFPILALALCLLLVAGFAGGVAAGSRPSRLRPPPVAASLPGNPLRPPAAANPPRSPCLLLAAARPRNSLRLPPSRCRTRLRPPYPPAPTSHLPLRHRLQPKPRLHLRPRPPLPHRLPSRRPLPGKARRRCCPAGWLRSRFGTGRPRCPPGR